MQAVLEGEHGGAEVLHLQQVPDPVPGQEEVLIAVSAAGINRADALQRRGLYPPPSGTSAIYGLEVSGTIERLGPGAKNFRVGDRVVALLAAGGYAQKVAVSYRQVLPLPPGLALQEAAALPEVAATVYSNLILTCGISENPADNRGKSLLVHGGSGGIGSHAIQYGRALGLRVFATAASSAKCAYVGELGALPINYRTEDFCRVVLEHTAGKGVDYILDVVGGAYLDQNLLALAPGGHLSVIGLSGGAKASLNLALMLTKRLNLHATSLRSRSSVEKEEILAGVRRSVWPLVEAGEIKTNIDRVFALEDVAQAHAYFDSGEHRGKILLTLEN